MGKEVFNDFHFLEGILLISGAVGCLTFCARTHFWLPKHIHVLAAIDLIVGALSVWASPADAPIKQHGLIACVLLALALPAMIYAYFILHGGQRVGVRPLFVTVCPMPILPKPGKGVAVRRSRDANNAVR
jgi:hypothetical protein